MDTKYYTPEIEEINVGFEYEWRERNTNDIWTPSKYSIGFDLFDCGSGEVPASYVFNSMNDVENPIEIRVKYLDQQDIEELGFISEYVIDYDSENCDLIEGYRYVISNTDEFILHKGTNGDKYIIYFEHEYNTFTGNTEIQCIFRGYIKNKSELKKLMKQLNITINNKTNG